MEGMEYLYELFEALPRCGPGDNESTRRAFRAIPKSPNQPLILDIGCGPGVQTVELARIAGGNIVALDNHQPFLDKLIQTASNEELLDHITPKNISMLDMEFADNSFDIIWSEGALYFMGFQNGLRKCHQLLKQGGYMAVTEIVYLVPTPPTPVTHYFDNEYPDILPISGKIELIQHEGFCLIDHFTLSKSCWFDNYYLPMEKVLSRLKKKYQDNEIALGIFAEMDKEIHLYKKYSDIFGYEFFVMQKLN